MSAKAESGPPDPSKSDKGKGIVTHTRHVSIEENLHSAGRLRASSSPVTASSLPSMWPPSDFVSRYPLTDARKASENDFSHQSSQPVSSTKAYNQPPTTPVEASSSTPAKINKDVESSNTHLEGENEAIHVKEKPRIDHHRRLSSKSHASPRQSSNHLDYSMQNPEDPTRSTLSWWLLIFFHLTTNADIVY